MAVVASPDKKELKGQLAKKLKSSKKYRERIEPQWRRNETTVYYSNSRRPGATYVIDDTLVSSTDVNDETDAQPITEMAVNYAWKFLRFIHSQMSANPPSVICRPTSTDEEDRRKADAADRIVRHGYQDKDAQELFDLVSLKVLTYGTAWVRTQWDADEGDTFEFEEERGGNQELTMTGDIRMYSPSTWDVWIDPNAKCWRDVRYVFERIEMPRDEAEFKWPKLKDEIGKFIKERRISDSEIDDWREQDDIVEVYFYIEKAAPINGMAGCQCYMLEDGTILGNASKNRNPGETLGYAIITDIDVPDQVYGKSFVEYVYRLQELLNRLDTSFVDNIAAHNVVRMILPEGAEIEDESLTNSAWDYIKITGNSGVAPYFAPAAQLMPDAHKLRENLIQGIQELAGVNDALQGKTSREVSGFSLQTMIDAGNQTRRRLFNKYTLMVRDVWRQYLALARTFWKEPRTIQVIGKEKAFEAADFSSADIDGGYDIICEYGASLSLDPARRREEIMQLMPVFEKAGIKANTVLSMLRLNELDSLYDRSQLAADRQREDFEQIAATGSQVPPKEIQDHAGRLEFAYHYVETAEYKYLDEETQALIDEHIKMREQFAAQAATKGQGAPQPGQPPAPGVPMAPPAPAQSMPAALPVAA